MQDIRDYLGAVFSAIDVHVRRFWYIWTIVLMVSALFLGVTYRLTIAAPADFPAGHFVVIKTGSSVPTVASMLAVEHVIAHPKLFTLLVRVLDPQGLQAGVYVFPKKQSALTIALRLMRGVTGVSALKLTEPEGKTVREIALQVASQFPHIEAKDFFVQAKLYEGYLFPDTYQFFPDASATDIIQKMRDTFSLRIASYEPDIK